MFLHSSCINRSDSTIHTIDGDLIGRKSYNGPMSAMSIVCRYIVSAPESSPENPCWRYGRSEMRVGYLG